MFAFLGRRKLEPADGFVDRHASHLGLERRQPGHRRYWTSRLPIFWSGDVGMYRPCVRLLTPERITDGPEDHLRHDVGR